MLVCEELPSSTQEYLYPHPGFKIVLLNLIFLEELRYSQLLELR